MPKRSRQALCDLCGSEARYTCPRCSIHYCSLDCYKIHKEDCIPEPTSSKHTEVLRDDGGASSNQINNSEEDVAVKDDLALKPLTGLKWPFIPEEPSFQDPLKTNDPKPLKLPHYEAIAMSVPLRKVLGKDKDDLRDLLKKVDSLRGPEREEALEYLLGVSNPSKRNRIPDAILESANHDSLESFKQFTEIVRTSIESVGGAHAGLAWDSQNTE